MTIQNLCDAAKAVLRGKFIATQSYLKKQEKHQIDSLNFTLKTPGRRRTTTKKNKKQWIDNLTLHLNQLDKEEEEQQKTKPK